MDPTPLPDALARLLAATGVPQSPSRFRARIGPLVLSIPITRAIARTILLHDLHHIATGYPTTLIGEAEIAAWELAGGCGRHAAAWAINIPSMALGLLLAPRRTLRAFARGRGVVNLFRRDPAAATLSQTTGALRARLSKSETQP